MNVRAAVKSHGLTMEQVAERMGINRVSISRFANNNPTVGTLRKIASAAGCSVAEFFADEVAQQPFCVGMIHTEQGVYTFTDRKGMKKAVAKVLANIPNSQEEE